MVFLFAGNGAPDVFTAWTAIQNSADLSLVLAELLGASIFITTVVLGAVILVSHARTPRDDELGPLCEVECRGVRRQGSLFGILRPGF